MTDPYQQYPAYATFSYENDLIDKARFDILTAGFKACQGLIYEAESGPMAGIGLEIAATEFCSLLSDSVLGNPLHPKFNVYDIRETCDNPPLCYDFSPADDFLNLDSTKEALGVPERTHWAECNQMVHTFLLGDWMTNLMPQVASILDNTDVEVLVYSGDKDWICNWRGGEAWTAATKWAHQDDFNAQDYQIWNVDDTPAGEMKQYGNYHFLRVYDAGHMVPMDQPQNALDMLTRFINNDWDLSAAKEYIQ